MTVSTSPTEASLQLQKPVEFQDFKQQINWKINTPFPQLLSQSSPRLSQVIVYESDAGIIEYKATWITYHIKGWINWKHSEAEKLII